jgi:hypothetical protein
MEGSEDTQQAMTTFKEAQRVQEQTEQYRMDL